MSNNPYAPLQSASIEKTRLPPSLTVRQKLAILRIGLCGGAMLGALTNAVNGAVSPQYFRDVMGWHGENIWLSAIGQGVFEGCLYGLADTIVFVVMIAVISRRRCEFQTVIRYVGLTFVFAFGFWIFGGLIAAGLSWFIPHRLDPRFFGDLFPWPAAGCHAWVRGSIEGIVFGGLCSVFLTTAIYAIRHRRAEGRQSPN